MNHKNSFKKDPKMLIETMNEIFREHGYYVRYNIRPLLYKEYKERFTRITNEQLHKEIKKRMYKGKENTNV